MGNFFEIMKHTKLLSGLEALSANHASNFSTAWRETLIFTKYSSMYVAT